MGLGWGIVGFGWVARDYMAPAIRAAGQNLVGVFDPDPAAQAAAAGQGARAYSTVVDLLADPAVEAVYIATPNHRHRAAVEAAARAGKAVLCEKPMAATLDDAEAMARACRRAGVLYGTAFDQRHHPAHQAVQDQVRAGRIGTVTAVRIVYACWVGRDWSACGGHDNWRIDPAKAGGGALMDLAPHGIDLIEFLLGEPIVDIAALTQTRVQDYEVDDGALLIGRTAAGVLIQLHVAYNCPERLPRRRLEIIGDRGQLTALDTMGQDPGGAVTITDERGAVSPVEVPDAGGSPFRNQVRAFGDALHDPAQTAFSIGRDLHTMRLLARAYASAESAAPAPERLVRAGA